MLTRFQENDIRGAVAAARKELIPFIKLCDQEYVASRVHRLVAHYLERVERGEIKRLIISMPPRHGKSTLTSIYLPAHALGLDPGLEVVVASYTAGLSSDASKATRHLLQNSEAYRAIHPDAKLMDRSVVNWSTTKQGKYRAVGVQGTLTGRGGDLIIVDDPHKDHAEAHSPIMRQAVWDWYASTLFTRQSYNARIIINHTRWHEDDLAGRILKEQPEDWTVLKLPAIAKENDPLGRKPGEALFPERFPIEHLLSLKKTLGSYKWSALYDQDPVPEGGSQIPVQNFQLIDRDSCPNYLSWSRYWDLAESEKKTADNTASCSCALDSAGNLYIADMLAGQWAWGKARNIIRDVAAVEGVYYRVGIETNGGFGTAYENLREVMPSNVTLREYQVEKAKLIRALPWIALAEARKIFLVRSDARTGMLQKVAGYEEPRDWAPEFKDEARIFPNGLHDDRVDCVSGGWKMCDEGKGSAEKVERVEREDDEAGFGHFSRRALF